MFGIEYFILLPILVALFWFLKITLSVFRGDRRKMAISFFMLSILFSIVPELLFYLGEYDFIKVTYVLTIFFGLSQFPAFYNYIVSLTSEKSNSKFFYVKHWVFPIIATYFAYFIQYRVLNSAERTYYVEQVLTGIVEPSGKFQIAYLADKAFKLMFVFSGFFYFHLINKRVNDHEEQILDYFSNTDDINFNWFKIFRVTFFFAFISGIVYGLFDRSFHLHNPIVLIIVFTLSTIFYWVVGFFGNKQINIYKVSSDEKSKIYNELLKISTEEIKINDNKAKEIARSIDVIVEKNKLFLNDNLNLIDLVLATRVDRNSLLYVIKDQFNLNFRNYINKKRIEYAKNILSSNEIVPIDKLYKECGFSSRIKFNYSFKEFTNETPTSFRNKILLSEVVY
jgi:AraC-like DNA-binding protein